jgi:hypothetical protein
MSDHTTIIRTDFEPSEVIVRGGDGRWHKVLNELWDAGIVASISDAAWRTLGAVLRLRTDDRPDCIHAPLGELMRLTGYKSDSPIYRGVNELTGHPAGLLARVGPDLYHALPGWHFAGRRGFELQNGESSFPKRGKFLQNGENASGNARAPNQTQEEKTEKGSGAVHPSGVATVAAIERAARARQAGKRGWVGFPLFWNLEGILCPKLALGLLEVGDADREYVLEQCKGLTVAEIDTEARSIASGIQGVEKPARLLCYRLCRNHGKPKPPARASVKQASVEAMRAKRVAEAVRAAGGGR